MAKTAFVDGNPALGTLGTLLTAAFLNAMQEHVHDGADIDGHCPLINGVPAGASMAWHTETPPTGWLECDGASLSRATYAALFAAIGTTYGNADGTHFNLPDLRGKFIRGWAHGQATDPDRASRTDRGDGTTGDHVGTKQAESFKAHVHNVFVHWFGGPKLSQTGSDINGGYNDNVTVTGLDTASTGGNETRPINTNVMYIIKY